MKLDWKTWLAEKGETLEGKAPNDLAQLFNEFNALKNAEIEKAIEEKASKSEILSLREEFLSMKEAQVKSFEAKLKEQGLVLEKVASLRVDSTSKKSFGEQIKDALEANKDALLEAKLDSSKSVRIVVANKAATDPMLQGNGLGTITGNVPQPYRERGFVEQDRRRPFVLDWLDIRPLTQSDIVEWTEQVLIEETTGGTAENALKNDMHWQYVVRTESAKTRTVTTVVSTRMLDRIDLMSAEINKELRRSLEDDIESQVLFGDGTGDNLNGIFTQAPAFAAGTFAGTIDNANNFDVLRVAMNIVKTAASSTINGVAQSAGYMPTVIVVNPTAAAEMDLSKGSDGHYVLPPFISNDGTVIKGVPVVESNFLGVDQFLVMEGAQARFYPYESMTIEVGLVNDQFKKNLRTVLGEHSALLAIPQNKLGAFVTGLFSVAKAALETP